MSGGGATPEAHALFQRVLSPSARLLGAELLSYDAATRTVRVRFQARPEFTNIIGAVQGGFVAAMLDEAAGMAGRLSLPESKAVPSLDFHVSFLEPTPTGELIGEGQVLRLGRRTAFLQAVLRTVDGKELARMAVTSMVVDIA